MDAKNYADLSRGWIDEWLLGRILSRAIQNMGVDYATAERAVGLIKLLTANQRWFEFKTPQPANRLAFAALSRLLRDSEVQQFMGVNRHQRGTDRGASGRSPQAAGRQRDIGVPGGEAAGCGDVRSDKVTR